jgi:hypothetical protein
LKVEFSRRFAKDLRSINLKHISTKVLDLIETIARAESLAEFRMLKEYIAKKGIIGCASSTFESE